MNERANGLVRQCFPKAVDFRKADPAEMDMAVHAFHVARRLTRHVLDGNEVQVSSADSRD